MVNGICCEYCTKQETKDCPVKRGVPWSRWKNFCSEFEHKETNKNITKVYLSKENK